MCDIKPKHIPFSVFKFIDTYLDIWICVYHQEDGRYLKKILNLNLLKVGRDLKFDLFRILVNIVNWKGFNPSNIFLTESL